MPQDELDAVRDAVVDLLYPSETDAPFDVFNWGVQGPPAARDQVAAHVAKGQIVQELPLDVFFTELDESDDAERFRQLRRSLEANLEGVRVFRVGRRRIDVYLIGRTASGAWAGVHTISVET